jgi:hypothetical protein
MKSFVKERSKFNKFNTKQYQRKAQLSTPQTTLLDTRQPKSTDFGFLVGKWGGKERSNFLAILQNYLSLNTFVQDIKIVQAS